MIPNPHEGTMNFWFLVPLIACILNINLVVYIITKCKQRKLAIAYSAFVLLVAAWEAIDFITWLPTFPDAFLPDQKWPCPI